jgi:SAM-dependent methyltransferase
MTEFDRRAHWQDVYSSKDETEVSWFEQSPAISLDLIRRAGAHSGTSIVDIGGGASRLVDALLEHGYQSVSVLDISEQALSVARARLRARASQVRWIEADVTRWEPEQKYGLWHDRAAFHFLTDPKDRSAYAERLMRATSSGAQVIIGTFAPDGPDRCSGLPVTRHDVNSLEQAIGASFEREETRPYEHRTPGGSIQRFQFSRFRKLR